MFVILLEIMCFVIVWFFDCPQEEIDRSFFLSSPNGNKQSLYEALRQSGAANLLENLQSQLKQRDGEILHLQVSLFH